MMEAYSLRNIENPIVNSTFIRPIMESRKSTVNALSKNVAILTLALVQFIVMAVREIFA
jgi:hypothetical protein